MAERLLIGVAARTGRSAPRQRHPIGRTMVEQSVTKIFLANPEAVREEYVEGFGLSEAEYDIVMANPPSTTSIDRGQINEHMPVATTNGARLSG